MKKILPTIFVLILLITGCSLRENAIESNILNNLGIISTAAEGYFVETGEEVATVELLVEKGYLRSIPESINGESYAEISLNVSDSELCITDKSNKKHCFEF
jgi:hypothetical protein